MKHARLAVAAAVRTETAGRGENKVQAISSTGSLHGAPRPLLGWRECSVSGCPCRAYEKAYGTELCGNCGHDYREHW